MSTILDSLKKSSDSRGDNEKTSIDSFSFSDNGNPRKSNFLVILMLILVTGILLYFGYHYLYPNPNQTEITTNNKAQTVPEQNSNNPQIAETSENISIQKKNKIEKPDSTKVKKILQDKTKISQQIDQNKSITQNKTRDVVNSSSNFNNLNQPLKNNVSKKPTALKENKQPVANTGEIHRTDINPLRPIKNYKLAYQLPFAIRKDLPEMILNIHVYDQNPNNRIAIINGEKFEVNALIADEVLVKEIVFEGVVLEFKNETFLLPKL